MLAVTLALLAQPSLLTRSGVRVSTRKISENESPLNVFTLSQMLLRRSDLRGGDGELKGFLFFF